VSQGVDFDPGVGIYRVGLTAAVTLGISIVRHTEENLITLFNTLTIARDHLRSSEYFNTRPLLTLGSCPKKSALGHGYEAIPDRAPAVRYKPRVSVPVDTFCVLIGGLSVTLSPIAFLDIVLRPFNWLALGSCFTSKYFPPTASCL